MGTTLGGGFETVYGWRARLGVVLPADNAVVEPEFASLGLEGVSCHAVRLRTTDRPSMPDDGIDAAEAFRELVVDAVGYACLETSSLRGVDQNLRIAAGVGERSGVAAVTATSAMIDACRALDVTRVALAAPYEDSTTHAVIDVFAENGLKTVSVGNQPFPASSPDEPEWYQTNLQPATVAYRLGRRADTSECDVIVICSTNLRSFDVIEALERDSGKPVISTNSALLWWLLRATGARPGIRGLGKLHCDGEA